MSLRCLYRFIIAPWETLLGVIGGTLGLIMLALRPMHLGFHLLGRAKCPAMCDGKKSEEAVAKGAEVRSESTNVHDMSASHV